MTGVGQAGLAKVISRDLSQRVIKNPGPFKSPVSRGSWPCSPGVEKDKCKGLVWNKGQCDYKNGLVT